MILRLYLSDQTDADVAGFISHNPETGKISLAVHWPEILDGKAVIGFTLTASIIYAPLALAAGDMLLIPLPPVIAVEP